MPIDSVTGIEYLEFEGHRRYLARLAPEPGARRMATWSGAGKPMIPRSAWKPVSYSGFTVPILDQNGHNSCVGHAAAAAFWKAWLMGGGESHAFSADYIYSWINNNRDAGASISDALAELMQHGVAFLEQVPEGTVFRSRIQDVQAADTTATRFEVGEGYHVDNEDELGSALQCGFIPFYGIRVGGAFQNMSGGANAIAPVEGGMGNHAQFADGMGFLPDGTVYYDDINSWGGTWNNGGRCRITNRHLWNGSNDPDCCVIQVVKRDPQDTNLPPTIA